MFPALPEFIIIFGAQYLPFVLVAAVLSLWFRKHRVLVFKSLVAAGLALAAAEVLKYICGTSRPFMNGAVEALISIRANGAFPSSHTAALAALATVLLPKQRELGLILLLGSIVVGACRILVGVHYPVDILGGFVLGVGVGWFVVKMRKFFSRRR